MLPAAAFAVIEIADRHPAGAARFVVAGNFCKGLIGLTRQHVFAMARLTREGIGRSHEHVVAEFIEVAPVTKPWTGRR